MTTPDVPFAPIIDVAYPQNPWEGISTNQRQWYDPFLAEVWRRRAIYNRFVTNQFNLYDVRAPSMTITRLIPPQVDASPVALRQHWFESSYMDSEARTVSFHHYAGRLSFHKYDNLVTYWKKDRVGGLVNIIREGLGHMMTEMMDFHARNAFLAGSLLGGYSMFGQGTGTNFSAIEPTDVITTSLLDDIRLGMHERDVPYVADPEGPGGTMILITTPGVVRDLQYEASEKGNANAFVDVMRYANATRIINGEVGTYHGFRIIQTPRAILYNCGPIIAQHTIIAPISAGDGAPHPGVTKVDGVVEVGQPDAVHSIALDSVDDFAINDMVTIHVQRTDFFGVENGVDFRDGKLHNRRIVAIDTQGKTITLDKPIMQNFLVPLDTDVYGYVTKGTNIHTAVALGGNDGVVQAVSQPPRVYELDPFDDALAIYRFTFDMYMGWQMWEPRCFETLFLAGSNKIKGPRYIR